MRTAEIIAARAVMEAEAHAILTAAARLNADFARAVDILAEHAGKTVVIGIGKSGRIAEKIVSTLCSTGTPAVFLHAAEAGHGDLGIYAAGDPTILISKSGATTELLRLIPALKAMRSPLIGILGSACSPLAREVDVLIDASVRCEADPHDLAPTASAAVALALGDALAIAVMRARNFGPSDFARNHPQGQLGRRLHTPVREVMHAGAEVAWARPADAMRAVIVAMTRHPLGAACVIGEDGWLEGIITDGDLRRALEAHENLLALPTAELMTRRPVTVSPDATLQEALRLMEDRPSQISVLPVVDAGTGCCLGLLRIHDVV
jgi:arabinose-5-phosphate isomerase